MLKYIDSKGISILEFLRLSDYAAQWFPKFVEDGGYEKKCYFSKSGVNRRWALYIEPPYTLDESIKYKKLVMLKHAHYNTPYSEEPWNFSNVFLEHQKEFALQCTQKVASNIIKWIALQNNHQEFLCQTIPSGLIRKSTVFIILMNHPEYMDKLIELIAYRNPILGCSGKPSPRILEILIEQATHILQGKDSGCWLNDGIIKENNYYFS